MNTAKRTFTISLAALLLLGSSEQVQAFKLDAQGSALRASGNGGADGLNHLSLIEQDIAHNANYLKTHPSQSLVTQYDDYSEDEDEDDSDDSDGVDEEYID